MTFFKVIKVTGSSLEPAFREGDFVFVSRIPFLFFQPRPGDVVVFQKPPYGLLIKKVEAFYSGSRQVIVRGDHPQSIDSRRFGPVALNALWGKVIGHVRKRQ